MSADIPDVPQTASEPVYYKAATMECVEVAPGEFQITQIDEQHDFSKPDPDNNETGFDVSIPIADIGVFGKVNRDEKWIEWGIRVFGCTLQKVRVGIDGGRIGFKNALGTAEVRLYKKGNEVRAGVTVGALWWDKNGDFFIVNV
ncbi:hypothetical protein TWF694_001844 [Orbilia ellipsospora]|uniref:Uncharacterized protein n=1 Tax=Orbilia ellipsospora TaxID=2528407 RepID=A0AAV9X4Z8_9PEZI